ncbi:MAG: N-acetylglutamate synthase, partial [Nocardioidaceae bacterium]|nr:N-acetylglutamate synthase [Nocardioidaceae bacterium]
LGPWCVGTRVVVRRRLSGRTGPSGGPALTDLLGILDHWGDRTVTVRAEDGTSTVIDRTEIVAGKPVPPRPSARPRVSAEEAQHRAVDLWPPLEQRPLGDWVLRASAGFSARGNSALLAGEPDRPWEEALGEVRRFYADRALPTWTQVVDGSPACSRLEAAGWAPARPGDQGVAFLVGGVATARRALRLLLPAPTPAVTTADEPDAAWLAQDRRAVSAGDAAVRVLTGPAAVTFAAVRESGTVLAKGRAALSTRADVWVGLTDVWVAPDRRRQRLAAAVVGALLRWGAEQGAATVCLQVRRDNAGALAFYDRLGLTTHHSYAYLAPLSGGP